jgi:hypothetical protein
MPSLAEGIAALTAHVRSAEVNAAKQYVVFPNFYFPLTQGSVASDGGDAAFDFIHLVNMVASEPPEFELSENFVWSVFEDVLLNRVLPSSSDPQQGFARRFLEAKAKMGDGLLTPEGHHYFETSALPRDLDTSNAWIPVRLGPDKIKTLAAQLSPIHRQWLSRFNLLSELGDSFLESVHFEQLTLLVLRPWFDASVFTWRFWNLPGEPISDGGDPPRGRLPGLISKIVLVRNLKMKLAAVPLSAVEHIFFRRAPGGPEEPARPLMAVEKLKALSGADIRAVTSRVLKKPLRSKGGDLKTQIDSQKRELAKEIREPETPAAGARSQKFHVPFSFDTEGPRALTTAALDSATTAATAKKAALDAAPQPRAGFVWTPSTPAVAGHWERERFAGEGLGVIPNLQDQFNQAQAEVARWSKALDVLNQLQAIQADQTCYVLALVCDRLPKTPDPDPSLFRS